MKKKTKKQRLAISKKRTATIKRNTEAKISSLQSQIQDKEWRLQYINAGLNSGIDEWLEMLKYELSKWYPVWPGGTSNNTITSAILPYFNKRLRDAFFQSEIPKYSYEWWLIDTGKQPKHLSFIEMFAQEIAK